MSTEITGSVDAMTAGTETAYVDVLAGGGPAPDGPPPDGTGTGAEEPGPPRAPGRVRARVLRAVRAAVRAPAAVYRGLSGLTGRALRRVAVGLGVLLIGLACTCGVLAWQAGSASAVDGAGTAALAAARTELPLVLSYSAATLDTDLDRARQQITGAFAEQFDPLATSVIAPATREQQISTTATVVRGGVVSAATDRVETLLFVNQSTTSKASPQARPTASQVRVVMVRVAGRWLISEVTPI